MRDRKHLWGLPEIVSGKARIRLEVGNWLLRVAQAVVQSLALAAGSCSLEHPEDLGTAPRGEPAFLWQPRETAEVAHADGGGTQEQMRCVRTGASC